MSPNLIPILVPMIWTVVSVAVAMILYRTSKGLFERTGGTGGPTTRIRLTGSIVIAACVFVALWKSTPPSALDTEHQRVDQNLTRRLADISHMTVDAKMTAAELKACVEMAMRTDCGDLANSLGKAIERIGARANVADAGGHVEPSAAVDAP